MANHPRPLNLGALLLAGGLAALVLGTALALALRADQFSLRPAEWAALRFTLKQAALSALVSGGLAVPLARALARRRFWGRGVIVTLLGAPFLLPIVVAVIGILSVYGRTGIANQMLAALHLPTVSVFGLQGVVLTNVFFNLPLCARILLNGWQAIPAERFRLAETLNLPASARFRHLELPMLRQTLPGAFVVVFLLCLTSFVVSLTFGGGPRATTLELAIYQALRFDFDLGRAALLASLQFAVCAVLVGLAARFVPLAGFGSGQDRRTEIRGDGLGIDLVVLILAVVFLMLPLVMVVAEGAAGVTRLPTAIWRAALQSTLMALIAALLAVGGALTLVLAVAAKARAAALLEGAAMLPMAASGLVLGTGIFLILRPWTSPDALALPVTVLVNAAMALPITFRLLLPEARSLQANYARLAATLDLRGFARLRYLTLPRLARPLGLGAGIAAAQSMGDLGVIALFAGDRTATLPLMISRLAGAYRLDQAAAASVLLVAISFALFALFDRGSRHVAP
ncbi:MAG: ABC transporter permease subunit [Pseudorhodobacter sp.]|nr:ABC transporter permease subunit [Pseudorhodobacter sp.]